MFTPKFNEEFGQLVITTRTKRNITQAALAKRLKMSAQFLGRIEKGNARMPLTSLKRTKTILKLDTQDIVNMAREGAETFVYENLK